MVQWQCRRGSQTADVGDIQTAHTAKLFSQDPFSSSGYDIAVDWRFCEALAVTLAESAAAPVSSEPSTSALSPRKPAPSFTSPGSSSTPGVAAAFRITFQSPLWSNAIWLHNLQPPANFPPVSSHPSRESRWLNGQMMFLHVSRP